MRGRVGHTHLEEHTEADGGQAAQQEAVVGGAEAIQNEDPHLGGGGN